MRDLLDVATRKFKIVWRQKGDKWRCATQRKKPYFLEKGREFKLLARLLIKGMGFFKEIMGEREGAESRQISGSEHNGLRGHKGTDHSQHGCVRVSEKKVRGSRKGVSNGSLCATQMQKRLKKKGGGKKNQVQKDA